MTNIKVKILGKVVHLTYEVSHYYSSSTIRKDYKVIDTPVIWEGELEYPPFERGESIYIDELSKPVYIEDIVRSTLNNYIYYVDYQVGDVVEDDNTEKSLVKAKKEFEDYEEELEKTKAEKLAKQLAEEELKQEDEEKSKFRKIIDILKS